jgi:type IV pilus assembly protein PilM
MWFRRTKPLIGIDIGSHAIKLVRFARTGNSHQLLDLALLPIPPDTVVDGVIGDLPGVQGMLRRLITLENITDKDVALALSGHSVIVKKVKWSGCPRKNWPMPCPTKRAAYPLRRVRCQHGLSDLSANDTNPNRSGQMEVLLAAAKRAAWMS